MANRYWVGGSGTWNTTSTTNWSATSGGSAGASVPTAADSVFFDQAGTYTVTMTGALACLDLTVSAGTVTFGQGTSPTLSIAGNVTIIAGTTWNMSGNVTFTATTSKTITLNDIYFANVIFNGAGGTWTLGSAAQFRSIVLNNGAFSTSASNYSLFVEYITINANSNTKSLSFNGSTVTIRFNADQGFINNSTGNFTFNAGTSTILISQFFASGNIIIHSTQNLTFYNIYHQGSTVDNLIFSVSTNSVVYTINNLTFDDSGVFGNSKSRNIVIPSNTGVTNVVINGTLTISNNSSQKRKALLGQLFTSGTIFQARISATTVSLTDVDFFCINNVGGSAWTGTRLGDLGNNTNITTATPKTVYYSAATLGNWGASNWATSSGGTPNAANYPLPQDIAIIDNNSGTGTLVINDESSVKTLNVSSRTTSMTLNHSSQITIFENYTLSSSVTVSGTGTIIFNGTTSGTITTAGKTILGDIYIRKYTGSITTSDALTTTADIYPRHGSLILSNNVLNCRGMIYNGNESNSTHPLSINFGTASIECNATSGTAWNFSNLTNFSYSGTGTVNINNNTSTSVEIVHREGTESKAINVNLKAGSYAFNTNNGEQFKNLNFTGFSGSWSVPAIGPSVAYIYGSLTVSSTMTIGSIRSLFFSATSGSHTITMNGRSFSSVGVDFDFGAEGGNATWTLADNLSVVGPVEHHNGTINLNGKTFTVSRYETATGTKNLTFNSGILNITGSSTSAFNNNQPTGFTLSAGSGTGKISMSSSSAKTFNGGGSNYSAVALDQAGSGTLTVTGSNTFADISNSYGSTGATTIRLTAGTTQTVSAFTASGTAGKLLTLDSSSAGTRATLSKASGAVAVSYISVKDSNATGGALWRAVTGSVDAGNNLGWNFIINNGFFLLF